jgi:hypothetical protein
MEGSLPVNYCPHDIHVYNEKNEKIHTFKCKPVSIRLIETEGDVVETLRGDEGEISAKTPSMYMGLTRMPEERSIICSQVVAQFLVEHRMSGIDHCYVPDTGPKGSVRNEKGEIIGTKRLIKYF